MRLHGCFLPTASLAGLRTWMGRLLAIDLTIWCIAIYQPKFGTEQDTIPPNIWSRSDAAPRDANRWRG